MRKKVDSAGHSNALAEGMHLLKPDATTII